MFRRRFAIFNAVLCGTLTGLALWGLALGAQVRQHDPGLWTLRFQRVVACGLDYNGPPYTSQVTLWLSCSEADSWRLWPPGR